MPDGVSAYGESHNSLEFPPELLVELYRHAEAMVDAISGGCMDCRGKGADAARERGHDRHPRNCAAAEERRFAAGYMVDCLTQPHEAYFGLARSPLTAEGLE